MNYYYLTFVLSLPTSIVIVIRYTWVFIIFRLLLCMHVYSLFLSFHTWFLQRQLTNKAPRLFKCVIYFQIFCRWSLLENHDNNRIDLLTIRFCLLALLCLWAHCQGRSCRDVHQIRSMVSSLILLSLVLDKHIFEHWFGYLFTNGYRRSIPRYCYIILKLIKKLKTLK